MEKLIDDEKNIDIIFGETAFNKKIEESINGLNKYNVQGAILKNTLKLNNEFEDDLPEDSEYMYTYKLVVFGSAGANLERVKIKKSEFKTENN